MTEVSFLNSFYQRAVREAFELRRQKEPSKIALHIFDFFDLCPKCSFSNTVYPGCERRRLT